MAQPLALIWDLIARDNASATFSRVGNSAEKAGVQSEGAGRKIGKLGNSIGLFALAAGGAETIKLASDFQAKMLLIQNQAGATAGEVASMSAQVLKLAGPLGSSPDALATSLYHAYSVTKDQTQALNIMKIAAEGAKVGHADLEQTTNALTATVASGIPGIGNFSQAMGKLNTIVGAGDMTFQNLNDSLASGVLTVVKGYGVSINDVGAALATFGDNNIRGADAATMLRMAVQALAVPMKAGGAALEALGIKQGQLSKDMQTGGLNKALLDLQQHLKDSGVGANQVGEVLTTIFGKKAGPGLQVLEGQMGRFETKLAQVKSGGDSFGAAWDAWTKSNQGQTEKLRASAESLGVSIGNKVLPMVTGLVKFVNDHQGFLEGVVVSVVALKAALAAVALLQEAKLAGVAAWGLAQKVLGGQAATAAVEIDAEAAAVERLKVAQAGSAIGGGATVAGGATRFAGLSSLLAEATAYAAAAYVVIKSVDEIKAKVDDYTGFSKADPSVQKALNDQGSGWAGFTNVLHSAGTALGLVHDKTDQLSKSQVVQTDRAKAALSMQESLNNTLFATPPKVSTNVLIPGADTSTAKAKGFNSLLRQIPGQITTTVIANTSGAISALQAFASEASAAQAAAQAVGSMTINPQHAPSVSAHARGGYLDKGWNLVGEMGPELISPAGKVYPAQQTKAMLSSQQAAPVVNVSVTLDGRELKAVVDTQINEAHKSLARTAGYFTG